MIKSHNNNNFAMKFANGLTISVAFGDGNYCERRNTNTRYNEPSKVTTNTAEICIWDETNKDFEYQGDGVIGWLNADEIAQWISATQQATCIADIVIPKQGN
jgi:hypothetical protein